MAEDDIDDPEQEERAIRIQKLKREVEELAGGQMFSGGSDDCPPEIEEQFWEYVLAFERAESIPLFDRLVKGGLSLPSPDELDDSQLTAKLWEVIYGLALLGTYLHNTNHLSDRELYAHLWNDSLREGAVQLPDNPDFAHHIDLIGSGSEEDNFIYLKYYADEDERRRGAEEWADDPLPDHEQPPFDRDRRLPERPLEGGGQF
jgi:hypothetical protein